MAATVDTTRPGRPKDDGVVLSPVLKITRFYEMLEHALGSGAQLIRGGERMDHEARISPKGIFINPALLRIDGFDFCETIEAVREETFFPLLPIMVPAPAPHDELLDACLAFINMNRYGLRNSLWASDPSAINAFCDRVDNGSLLKANDNHIGFVPGSRLTWPLACVFVVFTLKTTGRPSCWKRSRSDWGATGATIETECQEYG
jgi:acyl-CoA reductase-like NAD-dependent aldehyde dehydrogenase